eukprot:c41290_g1_i1 orf=423-596(+)
MKSFNHQTLDGELPTVFAAGLTIKRVSKLNANRIQWCKPDSPKVAGEKTVLLFSRER